jgi:nicotinate-nucleotide adenylyltransferase
MVEAAISDNPYFECSRVELGRRGFSFTVETLARVQREFPGAQLYFLIGEDSLSELPSWYDPQRILAQARLGVMQRKGWEADLDALEQILPGISGCVDWLDVPQLGISSTEIRRRIRDGLPIRYLVPPPVEAYVRANRLHMEVGT